LLRIDAEGFRKILYNKKNDILFQKRGDAIMAENYTILVCDDEKEITDALEIYLTQEGYNVLKAYDGAQALEILEKEEVHLLLIDLMMPKVDGLTAVLKNRKNMKSSIPIIILSAKGQDTDKIMGLNYGADDYITKPFSPLEMVARVKSQLRRYTSLGTMQETEEENQNVFHSGGLVIDDERKEVTVDGKSVRLTRIEYNILLLLLRNKGKVFSIDEIYEKIWKEEAFCADNTVTVHIRHIREKIEIDPKNPRYLKVMWGIGYKVEDLDQ
jgi:DNA-binding response OmpR family regulator